MQESLALWRTKIATNGREWEQRNKALQAEKTVMAKHYAALKAAMEQFRVQQNTRLKQLSTHRCGYQFLSALSCRDLSLGRRVLL